MAQNSDWGPPLWRILHTLAEKLGRQTIAILGADEARNWLQLLRVTEGIMPCSMCRKHYAAWKRSHPVEALQGVRGPAFREKARKWLWDLHEDVNSRRGVDGGVPLEELEQRYGARQREEIQADINSLLKVLQTATMLAKVDAKFIKQWQLYLGFLRALVGL